MISKKIKCMKKFKKDTILQIKLIELNLILNLIPLMIIFLDGKLNKIKIKKTMIKKLITFNF